MAGKTKKYGEPERGQKWVAGVEANLEKATGKTLSEWVKIAKTCPHEKMMPRLKWFKDEHGLSMARAGVVIEKAFGADAFGWGDPETLVDNLFGSKTFAPQRSIYEAVEKYVQKLDGAILSPRKGYVALYRLKQFGAVRPSKDGLLVGLAMVKYPRSKKFVDVKNLGGGDRTKKAVLITSAKDFDGEAKDLIKAAWNES
jgi:predicted transport protein